MTDCVIENCVRNSENEFCAKHQQAKSNIDKTFPDWKNAYQDEINWESYLSRLATDDEIGTGVWVTEVASYLLSNKR